MRKMWTWVLDLFFPVEYVTPTDDQWSFDWRHTEKPDAEVRRLQIEQARRELVSEGITAPNMAQIIDRFQLNTGRVFE